MDIRTLAIVLSLTNLLQVIALFAQYRLTRPHEGLGWFTLGSAAVALGFAFNALRDSPSLGQFAIVANDALFVSGLALLYVGVLRFLDLPERSRQLIAFCAMITLGSVFFTYLDNDLAVRRVAISGALAALSFLIARVLVVRRTASTRFAYLLAFVFLADSGFFAVRALTPLTGGPLGDLFTASLTQTTTYLVALVTSTLWAFGFIILVNLRLNAENRESKENLELIFNTSPDAVLITRLTDGYFVRLNNGFTALTGFTRADVIGKSTLQIDLWADPAGRQSVVAALNEKGFCENRPVVFRRKDGSQFDGVLSARLISLQGVPHIASVTRDITERERAEKALRDSEERYRELVENANDIVYTLDLDGNFTSVNRAGERITGYTHDEILKLNLAQVVSHNDFALARQMLQDKVAERKPAATYPLDIFAKDGRTVSLELSTRLIYQEGTPVGSQGVARDITERRRLQEELEQQATTDDLIGIFNRRHFLRLAQQELKRAVRLKHPVAVALLDIDRLKEINDTLGHAAGDQTLFRFAKICKASIREIDVFARFGGDEFALLLPEANQEQAYQAIERVRATLAATSTNFESKLVSFTISAGISSLADDHETLDSLLARADRALYRAKEAGRNRVEVEHALV